MNSDDPSRQELARERTEWAEDRTIMANERTFAGWMRTGMAALGIGLGFRALFRAFDPTWVPKTIATVFIIMAIFIFAAAYQAADRLRHRLDPHSAEPASRWRMRVITAMMIAGATGLGIVMWLL